MRERTVTIIAGLLTGTLACAVLALPDLLPGALADEAPAVSITQSAQQFFRKPIDGKDFVKPPEIVAEPWVDMDIQSERMVRKIGFGRTTFVRIVTTATGVYSSDGLASPHIRYPGVHVEDDVAGTAVVAMLERGGWLRVSSRGARSFETVTPIDAGWLEVDR